MRKREATADANCILYSKHFLPRDVEDVKDEELVLRETQVVGSNRRPAELAHDHHVVADPMNPVNDSCLPCRLPFRTIALGDKVVGLPADPATPLLGFARRAAR